MLYASNEHHLKNALFLSLFSVSDQCSGVFCMIHSLGTKLADGHTVDIMGSCKRVLQQRQGCITSKVITISVHTVYIDIDIKNC